jgi:hypothetical protein
MSCCLSISLLFSSCFFFRCYVLINSFMFFNLPFYTFFLTFYVLLSILCVLCFCSAFVYICILFLFACSCFFLIFVQVNRPVPPGGKSIAVNKKSYHIIIQSHILQKCRLQLRCSKNLRIAKIKVVAIRTMISTVLCIYSRWLTEILLCKCTY